VIRSHRPTLAVLAALLLITGGCAASDDSVVAPIDIELGAADGGATTLADQGDGLLVVNLWATWCGPCVAEMPVFDAVADERSAEATVVGVNVGDTAAEATAFAANLGVDYAMFTDPDGRLQTALGVNSLPATVFIAPSGEVLDVHQGAYTHDELDAAIDRSLAEMSA
jgi:thiol-disulfide isomerase/thioredoxin